MKAKRNEDCDWDVFDTKSYQDQYRDNVEPADCFLGRSVVGAFAEFGIPLRSLREGIDVCNGGVMRGPGLIAPLIRDGGRVEWTDWGKPLLDSAREAIKAGQNGDLGFWGPHQEHLGSVNPAWSDSMQRACNLGKARQQSIFDLPEGAYDAAVTCFGPESLTGDKDQWQEAVRSFFRSVRTGGVAVMLYMVGSTGYSSAGEDYPATPVSELDVRELAQDYLDKQQNLYVDVPSKIRPDNDPHTHKGMGGLVGIRQ